MKSERDHEEKELGVGQFSDRLNLIVVAHGLISARARESFRRLQESWIEEVVEKLR